MQKNSKYESDIPRTFSWSDMRAIGVARYDHQICNRYATEMMTKSYVIVVKTYCSFEKLQNPVKICSSH